MGLSKKERREQKESETKPGVFSQHGASVSIRSILKNNWKFLLILLSFVSLIYANGMRGDFVSDDYASITQNPNIFSWSNFFESKSLVAATLTLVAKIFGTTLTFPYHIISLLCFWIILCLSYVFLRYISSENIAKLAVFLFSILPINVESVTWISGRPYLYGSIGILCSLLLTIKYMESKRKLNLVLIALCFLITYLGFHIRVLNIAPTVGLYLLFFAGLSRIQWFKLFFAGFIIVFIGFLVFYPAIAGRVGTVNSSNSSVFQNFYEPWYQYPTSVAKYLQLMLFPVDLTLYHTLFTSPAVLNWIVFLLYLVCVVYFFKRNKLISFGLLFIFVSNAGSLTPIKVAWLVAERYVFLGGVGFSLVLSVVFWNLYSKIKFFAYIPLAILLLIYPYRIFLRNTDWQTNHNLWVNTCYVSPNSHNAWNNIGDDYDKLGQYENAVKGFTQSTIVKPDYADAFHNRANIFFKMGRFDLARDSYSTALRLNPGLYQSRLSMVQVSLADKKFEEAVSYAFSLVKERQMDPIAHFALGYSLVQAGRKEEAKLPLRRTLELQPGFVQASELLRSIN